MKNAYLLCWVLLCLVLPSCPVEEENAVPEPAEKVSPTIVESPDAVWNGKIKVAAIFPVRGRYNITGTQSHNGTAMAVEDVNARGGVHGRELEILRYGTGSFYIDAVRAAELCVEDGAVAVLGSNSSDLSLEMTKVAQEKRIPMISNVSTVPNLTWDPAEGNREFVFRVCQSDGVIGTRLAQFAQQELRAKRAAVFYEIGRTYSRYLAHTFLDSFREPAGGYEAREFRYLKMEINFREPLEQIQKFAPDVLFIPGSFSDATLIAMQTETMGIRVTLLGSDSWSNIMLFKRGGPSKPAFFYDHWFPEEPFKTKYLEKHGEELHGGRVVLAYDAVMALVGALEFLGPLEDSDLLENLPATRERVMQSLKAVRLEGISGPISFDENGDRRKGGVIVKIDKEKRSRFPWPD